MTGHTPPCAHGLRTDAQHSSRQVPRNPACPVRPELQFRAIPVAASPFRHGGNDTANAVWVRAHPGFKSPSLRS